MANDKLKGSIKASKQDIIIITMEVFIVSVIKIYKIYCSLA